MSNRSEPTKPDPSSNDQTDTTTDTTTDTATTDQPVPTDSHGRPADQPTKLKDPTSVDRGG
jgi:hypothetical protein